MFSKRAGFDLALNALAGAAEARPPTWDLTSSNPDPDRLVLTATTSEAYSLLIKPFCDPGDRVLVPEPSYPLLPMLARLEGAVAAPYSFRCDGEWHIDRPAFLERLDPAAKLILAVSPNNPTGAFLSPEDLDFLLSHGLPVVLDEVFAAYDLRREQASPLWHTEARSGLLFSLGGLSKAAALPQLKLSWMAVSGNEKQVERALLQDAAEVSVPPVEGGWYQVLRLPKVQSEEAWVLGFLERGVLVQPGWFYDFPDEAWVVVSLLTPPQTLSEGLHQIVEAVVAAGGPSVSRGL